jgi:hypothetical protein
MQPNSINYRLSSEIIGRNFAEFVSDRHLVGVLAFIKTDTQTGGRISILE